MILSDLHANLEALEAALADADGRYDQILCCGDVVGYGADPNAVTEWVTGHVPTVVRGNHDKAAIGMADLEDFNPVARASAYWTQEELTASNLDYIRHLPQGPVPVDGFQLVHGSPLDEDEYVVTPTDAWMVAPYVDVPVTFFGHTHLQGGFLLHRNGVRRLPVGPNGPAHYSVTLEPDQNYLVNPGSIGQPRDGDPRAAYLIYDPETRVVDFYRVGYDIPAAQRKIVEAGLPDRLALRLQYGQ